MSAISLVMSNIRRSSLNSMLPSSHKPVKSSPFIWLPPATTSTFSFTASPSSPPPRRMLNHWSKWPSTADLSMLIFMSVSGCFVFLLNICFLSSFFTEQMSNIGNAGWDFHLLQLIFESFVNFAEYSCHV